jgi:hypothetical protein
MPTPINFSGGMRQDLVGPNASLDAPYSLLNFKQSAIRPGVLERTDAWKDWLTMADANTVYGVLSVPARSTIYIATTNHVYARVQDASGAWSISAIPIIVTNGLTTGGATGYNVVCRFVGVLGSDGDTLTVEIDGATTFRWRINSGAWTSLVPIAATVSLGGSVGIVYFKTFSGFTIGTQWKWLRQATIDNADSAFGFDYSRPVEFRETLDQVFMLPTSGILFEISNQTSGGTSVVVPAGYYGNDIGTRVGAECAHYTIYENHLFLFGEPASAAAKEFPGRGEGDEGSMTIYCSDLLDINDFVPTDVNEADVFRLGSGDCFLGSCILNSRLYVFTTSRIFYTDYAGLPNPFTFREFTPFACASFGFGVNYSTLPENVVEGSSGAYVFTRTGVWFFNGTSLQHISRPIDPIWDRDWLGSFGYYDAVTHELLWYKRHSSATSRNHVNVFQEQLNAFYRRSARRPRCLVRLGASEFGTVDTALVAGQASGKLLATWAPDTLGTVWVYDNDANTAFTEPVIATQYLDAGVGNVAEVERVIARIRSTLAADGTSNAARGDDITMTLYWRLSDFGSHDNLASAATNASAVMTGFYTRTVGQTNWLFCDFPRTAFKTIQFELRFPVVSTLPPLGIEVGGLVIGTEDNLAER